MTPPPAGIIHRFSLSARAVFHILAAGVLLFLYVPLVVLALFSFNSSEILSFPITGLTLKWYAGLLKTGDIQSAIWNSILVAIGTVPGTLIIGVPTAMALNRYSFPGKALFERVVTMPIIVPGLITGLCLLITLKQYGFSLSLGTVIIGHTVGCMPLVVLQVYARLRRLDPRLEEASLDLGANDWQTFWRVTFPGIRNAVIGSSLLVATLSLNDVSITFFLTGAENTLPMYVWAWLRRGVTPEINAIATLSMIISIIAVIVALRVSRAESR